IRLVLGWTMIWPDIVPPLSLLLSYWFVGSYFMVIKRYSEFREAVNPRLLAAYRRSFLKYSEVSLLVSMMFYGAAAMLFFGAFIMRYRIEWALSFPLVALVMAIYLQLAFEPHSPVQHPEKLHRSPRLMIAVVACAVLMTVLLFVDLPGFQR